MVRAADTIEVPAEDTRKKVFVISPIGAAESTTRQDADRFLNYIVKVALPADQYNVQRADEDDSPYAITEAMLRAILEADICIADITGRNPNVMYELALAHATGGKVIIMKSDEAGLPFDIKDMRAITYGFMPEDVAEAIRHLKRKATHEVESAAFREMLNPVATAFKTWMDVQRIDTESGSADQAFARVVEKFEGKLDRILGLSMEDRGIQRFVLDPEHERPGPTPPAVRARRLLKRIESLLEREILPPSFVGELSRGEAKIRASKQLGMRTELEDWIEETTHNIRIFAEADPTLAPIRSSRQDEVLFPVDLQTDPNAPRA